MNRQIFSFPFFSLMLRHFRASEFPSTDCAFLSLFYGLTADAFGPGLEGGSSRFYPYRPHSQTKRVIRRSPSLHTVQYCIWWKIDAHEGTLSLTTQLSADWRAITEAPAARIYYLKSELSALVICSGFASDREEGNNSSINMMALRQDRRGTSFHIPVLH